MSVLRLLSLTARSGTARVETASLSARLPEHTEDAARQLSLCDGPLNWEPGHSDGLCAKRYRADLVTEGVRYDTLAAGDRLRFGPVELEITSTGKRCFPDCPLRLRGQRCGLASRTAFAQVVSPGLLRQGQEGTLLKRFQ